MKKVLIVDDQPDIRKLIRMTLEFEDDYQCKEAYNGETALLAIDEWKPDVVVLDVMMPGRYNGLEVCRQIKSAVKAPTKVILLTARGQARDLEEGENAGADKYVVKPFSPGDLVKHVESVSV
jgi:two-component system phosphate regulon response regulator PhoB